VIDMLTQVDEMLTRAALERQGGDAWRAPRSRSCQESFVLDAPAGIASVPAARHRVAEARRRWRVRPDRIAAAELVVTELVTNAVIHAECPDPDSPVTVQCWLNARGRLHVAVADGDPRIPAVARRRLRRRPSGAAALPESGWGLSIVDRLAAVDIDAGPAGKTVHAVLR
jgi:anti-sigma regulatory factor (Ser/Thr protein kinase)